MGPGDQILADGQVLGTGQIVMDESMLTGDPQQHTRQAGEPVYAGSFCIAGHGAYEAQKVGSERLIAALTGEFQAVEEELTPLEQTMGRLLRFLLIVVAVLSLLLHLLIPEEKLLELKGQTLPYGNYLTKPGWGNALLLGDACGLADPLLGEGIYYAHRSGQIAAEALQAVYPHFDIALENYEKHLNQTLIRELKTIKIIRNIIFYLLCVGDYRLMALFIRMAQKTVEETIQGQRSFRRFSFF